MDENSTFHNKKSYHTCIPRKAGFNILRKIQRNKIMVKNCTNEIFEFFVIGAKICEYAYSFIEFWHQSGIAFKSTVVCIDLARIISIKECIYMIKNQSPFIDGDVVIECCTQLLTLDQK